MGRHLVRLLARVPGSDVRNSAPLEPPGCVRPLRDPGGDWVLTVLGGPGADADAWVHVLVAPGTGAGTDQAHPPTV